MPKLIKKILLVYISIVLTFAPSTVFAVSAGGWAFSSFDVATSVVTALKNGASASVAVAKSPISQKIGKGILGGVIAGAALPLAISQITGIAMSAVDWVFDPANNAIKWTAKPGSGVGVYVGVDYPASANNVTDMCNQMWQAYYSNFGGWVFTFDRYELEGTDVYCYFKNGEYGRRLDGKFRGSGSIPIPTVSDKIYDNAKTDSDSRSVVNDAVKEYVNAGSADTALDNAKTDVDATHGCGTGTHWSGAACVADTPTTPDTPFDPSGIIDAIKSVFDAVMSLPDVINNALDTLLNDIKDFFQPVIDLVTDFFQWVKDTATDWKDDFVDEYKAFRDWVKSDPDPQTDSKPDINDTQPTKSAQDFDSNYINFGGQCPSFSPTTISVGIVAVPISFNAQPLCDFAILCRPIILALAYFAAMAIVANAIRSE